MTLLLTGFLMGQLYVIDRTWTASDGKQITAGRIEGLLTWGNEQVRLGSDPAVLLSLARDQTPDPDPAKHTFVLLKLPSPTADCAYVLANQSTLFPR